MARSQERVIMTLPISPRWPAFTSWSSIEDFRRTSPAQWLPRVWRSLSRQASFSAFLEFEPTDIAAADHALIVDDVAADDFGHHGQIEVADFRIALGETVKHTICRFDRGQFLVCHSDRPRLVA